MPSYTVKQGESYASISGQFFGNQRWMQALAEANGNKSLHPGDTINIPNFDTKQSPLVTNEFVARSNAQQQVYDDYNRLMGNPVYGKQMDYYIPGLNGAPPTTSPTPPPSLFGPGAGGENLPISQARTFVEGLLNQPTPDIFTGTPAPEQQPGGGTPATPPGQGQDWYNLQGAAPAQLAAAAGHPMQQAAPQYPGSPQGLEQVRNQVSNTAQPVGANAGQVGQTPTQGMSQMDRWLASIDQLPSGLTLTDKSVAKELAAIGGGIIANTYALATTPMRNAGVVRELMMELGRMPTNEEVRQAISEENQKISDALQRGSTLIRESGFMNVQGVPLPQKPASETQVATSQPSFFNEVWNSLDWSGQLESQMLIRGLVPAQGDPAGIIPTQATVDTSKLPVEVRPEVAFGSGVTPEQMNIYYELRMSPDGTPRWYLRQPSSGTGFSGLNGGEVDLYPDYNWQQYLKKGGETPGGNNTPQTERKPTKGWEYGLTEWRWP